MTGVILLVTAVLPHMVMVKPNKVRYYFTLSYFGKHCLADSLFKTYYVVQEFIVHF